MRVLRVVVLAVVTLGCSGAFADSITSFSCCWAAPQPGTNWISPNFPMSIAANAAPGGIYDSNTTFNFTSMNASAASISFGVAADDSVPIFADGSALTPGSCCPLNVLTTLPFAAGWSSDVVSGFKTRAFQITDRAGTYGNPSEPAGP